LPAFGTFADFAKGKQRHFDMRMFLKSEELLWSFRTLIKLYGTWVVARELRELRVWWGVQRMHECSSVLRFLNVLTCASLQTGLLQFEIQMRH